jgi:hypothetical protein
VTAGQAKPGDFFSGWRGFLAVVAGYVLFHFALRLALSPTIGVDDVMEAIFAQNLQWTYQPRQPPLYTWLLFASFKVFGVGVAAAAFVRYGLLAAGYLFFYLAARRMFADRKLALAAALSPSLIYAIGYGVHLGFTNTVLLTAACAATFYALLRVFQDGQTGDYAALGLALGLGLLSKWGYPVFAGALLVAALLQAPSRRRLADRRIAITLAVAIAIFAPFVVEGFSGSAFGHVFTGTMRKGGQAPYLPGVASGLETLVISVTMFLAPLWICAIAVFPKAVTAPRRTPATGEVDLRRLFEHFFLVMLVILLAGVFVARVSYFKSRWMHPVLILFPFYFFRLVEDAGYSSRRLRLWAGALALAAAAVLAALLAQGLWGAPYCGKCRLQKPYPELAREIGARGFSGGTVVAGDEHIAGNFRAVFPGSRVAASVYSFYVPPGPAADAAGQCLVVWDATAAPEPPPSLAPFLENSFGVTLPNVAAQSVEAPYRRGDPRRLKLDYVILPGAAGCR